MKIHSFAVPSNPSSFSLNLPFPTLCLFFSGPLPRLLHFFALPSLSSLSKLLRKFSSFTDGLVFSDFCAFLPWHRSSVFQHPLRGDLPPNFLFHETSVVPNNLAPFLVTLLVSPSTSDPQTFLSRTSPPSSLRIRFSILPYSFESFFSGLQRFIS